MQVLTDLDGRLLHVGAAQPGSTHDVRAFAETGLADVVPPENILADLGYLGTGLHLPTRKPRSRKPRSRKLTAAEKNCNRTHAHLRAAVERGVAALKTWPILDSGYRGPVHRFPAVLNTIIALEFFRTGW